MRLTRHALALTMVVLAGCAGQPSGSPVPSLGPVRSLLVDTDVAPDDLVALAFLIQSPAVEIAAITVSGTGEAHCAGGMDVALRLLERLEAPMIPVACGRETPLGGDHAFPDAWRVGADSGSDLDLPATERKPFDGTAVELIADTVEGVGELRILTLGPLTNLADALMSEPTLADQIESIYTMGGAVFAPGNVAFGGPPENQVAEWNTYVDPRAAQTVIGSGAVVRLISLDGTNQVPVTTQYAQRVLGEATSLAAKVMAELFAEHAYMTDGSYYLWDPLAAALAAGYPIGSFSPARVEVEEAEGPEVGFTRPIDGTPNVEYLSSADAGAAQDILLDTLNSTADEH